MCGSGPRRWENERGEKGKESGGSNPVLSPLFLSLPPPFYLLSFSLSPLSLCLKKEHLPLRDVSLLLLRHDVVDGARLLE